MASRNDNARQGYPGKDARQGEIILRSRRQRVVFVGGLVGLVLIALLFAFLV